MSKHRNPSSPERTSLAPYNFVALPKRVHTVEEGAHEAAGGSRPPWQAHDRYLEGTHSGWLDLELKAETPLYVRCAPPAEHSGDENSRTNRHRQEFFHHGDPAEPVIPGSSLRGMTRALVEILGFGAFRWFTDRKLIYRAVGGSSSLERKYREKFLGGGRPSRAADAPADPSPQRVRGGYLRSRGGDRFIQPAAGPGGESLIQVDQQAAERKAGINPRRRNDRNKYGDADVIPVWLRPPTSGGSHIARLRNADHIRRRKAGEKPPKQGFVPATVVRSGWAPKKKTCYAIYEPDPAADPVPIPHELWKLYEDDRDLTRGIPTRKLREGAPLFYLVDEEENLVFFGPTVMFRIPHDHSISELVPSHVRDPGTLDLAGAIFGTVDRKPAIKGRVFFEDALWKSAEGGADPFLRLRGRDRHSPKILSGPKPTSFQHYLAQPQPDDPKTLKDWSSDPEETEIRGHKRYWHKRTLEAEELFEGRVMDDPDDTQHTIIRPVRPGTQFSACVRFENLTATELGALLTALDLPESKRHHVGMGKPLGMGSTRIQVDVHLIDRSKRYARLVTAEGVPETGELDKEGGRRVVKRARETFEAAILDHAARSGEVDDRPNSLWEIPRLAELSALLEWDDAPPKSETGYKRPEDEGQTFPPFWKQRCVLPDPAGVLDPSRTSGGSGGGGRRPRRPRVPGPPRRDPVKPGETVQAVALEEKTRKGGWKFEVKGRETKAILHPQSPEPPDLQPGKELRLLVKAGGDTPQLAWEEEGAE